MHAKLYLNDTYLFEIASIIVGYGSDEKGNYVLLHETVFYPQGGGQPSDQGVIETADTVIPVHFVRQFEQEIRHYVPNDLSLAGLNNLTANIKIDSSRRLLNARYHTAAHLLGNVVENMHPDLKAVKGHSFPGEAYVEFIGTSIPDNLNLTDNIVALIKSDLATTTFEMLPDEFEAKYYKLPYVVPSNKKFRAMQIGDYMPVPCGGTHLASTVEIGEFTIRKISNKNGQLKISYGLQT